MSFNSVMHIESGGKGTDPMQSSESPETTRYPNKPNGITDPFYSIQCGVRYLKKCMDEAGVTNKDDIKKLQLAAQGIQFWKRLYFDGRNFVADILMKMHLNFQGCRQILMAGLLMGILCMD